MKYELGQLVFYLRNSHIHSAQVLTRHLVENIYIRGDSVNPMRCGVARIEYVTIDDIYLECDLFESADALIENLKLRQVM